MNSRNCIRTAWIVLISAWILFKSLGVSIAQEAPSLALTREEKVWQQANPVVRVGVFAGDHTPVEAWVAGQPQGLAVDYARLLADRAGIRLEFRPYSNWESVSFAPEGNIVFDMLLAQPVTPDRLTNFNMLRPFLTDQPAIVIRRGDERIHNVDDLAGLRVVFERRYERAIATFSRYHPGVNLLFVDEAGKAFGMVANGQADAYIGSGVRVSALLLHRPTRELVMLEKSGLPSMDIAPAVRKDNGMLTQILRKAESTITDSERAQLWARWGIQSAGKVSIYNVQPLTEEQRHWLSQLPTLRVGYEVDRYPYTFLDASGHFNGLAADYLREIEQRLGVQFEYVRADDWNDLQAMVKSGRVDLIAAGSQGDLADSDILFSQNYENFPGVIVARPSGPPIASPSDLEGRAVAIRAEPAMMAHALQVIGRAKFYPIGNNESGLSMVVAHKADAYIGTLPAVDYLIRSNYPSKVADIVKKPGGCPSGTSGGR